MTGAVLAVSQNAIEDIALATVQLARMIDVIGTVASDRMEPTLADALGGCERCADQIAARLDKLIA